MKNKKAHYLAGLLSLSFFSIAQAQAPAVPAEKAVAALEDQWTQSEKANTSDLIAPLLADKFMAIGTDGSISDKAKTLADGKLTKYENVTVEHFHIAVFGRTAIATMVFKSKGTDERGKPMDVHARYADTWVKMPNGTWQCVLSQGSEIK
jgi:hypothetical protein